MGSRRDVLILGGGVIGLSTAYYLAAESRLRVSVAERGEFGHEASWAGAGIIPPASRRRATTPFNRLLGLSVELFPELSEQLQGLTGIDNGFRRCGGVELHSGVDEAMVRTWRQEEINTEYLRGAELRQREPNLAAAIEDGYYQPDTAQVRNPRHMKALVAACQARGVELLGRTPVAGFRRSGNRIDAALTADGELIADRFLIATGAWSDDLLAPLNLTAHIFPIRGQIVLFHPDRPLIRMIVMSGRDYLVPREDGRVLAGSTEENVGFVRQNTPEAVARLKHFAISTVPALAQAPVERTWAGLRPATSDALPYLGRVPNIANLFLAAGHFRSGLMLSAATGKVMAELLQDQQPSVPLEAFAPGRAGP